MPVVLKIDSRRKVVYSTFYGRVTGEELLGHRRTIASDPGFNRSFNEIVDFTDVTDPAIGQEALRTLAASDSLYEDSVAHIIVAPADMARQLANQFKTLAGKRRNLFVVPTPAEAYKLLELGPEKTK